MVNSPLFSPDSVRSINAFFNAMTVALISCAVFGALSNKSSTPAGSRGRAIGSILVLRGIALSSEMVYALNTKFLTLPKRAPEDYFIPLMHPASGKYCPVPARGWRYPATTMQTLLESGQVIFGEDETTQPRRKYLLKENMTENVSSLLYYGGSDDALLANFEIPFDTPKPVYVAKRLIQSTCNKNDIVLDFFTGSATTAHATM